MAPDIDIWEAAGPRDRARMERAGRAVTSGQWKVVWSNGDENYVEATSDRQARVKALDKHGATAARIIYCERYG